LSFKQLYSRLKNS